MICALCLGENLQQCCLLCGEVFRESDNKKPIKCHTPDCPGIYCEQCFADLQNLCTICLSPIEYGDLSDISEEKDSSEEEPKPIIPKPIKKSKWRQLFFCSKCCQKCFPEDDEEEGKSKSRSLFGKKKDAEDKDSSDEEGKLLKEELNGSVTDGKYDEVNKMKDSDYYSSDSSTDYSYSYQYDKTNDSRPVSIVTPFKDVEKQEVPDYASMSSFREEADETEQPKTTLDKATAALSKQSAGTVISGTTFEENRKDRKVEFVGVPDRSKVTVRKKKKKRRPRTGEERPLLSRDSCPCTSSDTDDSDLLQHLQSPVLTLLKSSSTLITQNTGSPYTLSSEDKVKPSLASTVGAEIKSDVRYVEALIPQLDLSQVQCIHIPGCDTITSSSLDSEIKCNHEYVKMMVPELDLSSLTSTPHSSKNYVNNIFGNVKYDEVSESPKSTSSSSRHHNSSPDVSSENKYLNTRHSTTKVDKDIQTSTKAKVDIGVSAKPLDKYKFEEKQRKKVKQYYRAVKDIPSDRKAEDKRKSGKFMKFVQKIIPKRKKDSDVLPFYSKDRRNEVELRARNYNQSYFDTPTSTTLDSAILRQRSTSNRRHYISSEEEEEDRVRGGTTGHIGNYYHSLNISDTEDTSFSRIDTTSLTNLLKYSKTQIRKELIARYFVSIEDLTPTRDCDIPMTTIEPQNFCGCKQGEVLITELPEKDTVQEEDADRSQQPNAETGSTHKIQTLPNKNLSAATTSAHDIKTSSSSNLSESLCTSILGAPCSIAEFRANSVSSKNPSLRNKESRSLILYNKEHRRSSLHNRESAIKRESLSVIPETETVLQNKSGKPSEEQNKIHKNKPKEGGDQKIQPNLPIKQSSSCISKYCNCETIVHKDEVTQTCPASILKHCRVQPNITTIKSSVSSLSQQSENIIAESEINAEAMERPVSRTDKIVVERPVPRTDKIVETTEKYPVKESSTDPRTALTSDKNQQTSNSTIYSNTSHIDESSKIVQLSHSSASYCECQSRQSSQIHQSSLSYQSCPSHQSNLGRPTSPSHTSNLSQPNNLNHPSNLSRPNDLSHPNSHQSHEPSHSSCNYSSCKCPPLPPNFAEFVNWRNIEYGAGPRRSCPGCIEKHPKYVSDAPSDYSMHSTQRRPSLPMRRYMEFPSDSGYSLQESQYRGSMEAYPSGLSQHRPERPQSRQKAESIVICSCKGDCRSCSKRRKSPGSSRPPRPPQPPRVHRAPRTAVPSQYRPLKYELSTSSEDNEEDDESSDYYQDPLPNRHDLPYQNSDEYMDLVQELEETLQSRNRNRVRRAMQEFERRSKYNKPLEKPIIDYDETSESEEPIIQRISELTSEKQVCCGGNICTCRREARARSSMEKKSQPKQHIKKKLPQITHSEEGKTRWQMDQNSGEWYKVSGNQQRYKGRQRSATPSPRRVCEHECSCCAYKSYDYR